MSKKYLKVTVIAEDVTFVSYLQKKLIKAVSVNEGQTYIAFNDESVKVVEKAEHLLEELNV